MSAILEFRGVSKAFSDVQALQAITFSIPERSIFGLLGPNGAGKTTLIRIITKIFAADSGSILFQGKDIREIRHADIGYMPEEKGLYKKMKVGEQLIYLAALKGMSKRVAKENMFYWFGRLGMEQWKDKKVQDLSKGMQQKVQFVATVMHKPHLLILDEPFSGLDPVNSEMIKNEIHQLSSEGVTVLFSTHRMEQVEEMCNDIVLINKGQVILTGAVHDIKEQFKEHMYLVASDKKIENSEDAPFTVIRDKGAGQLIQLHTGMQPNAALLWMIQHDHAVRSFTEQLPSLQEIFIQQVKEKIDA